MAADLLAAGIDEQVSGPHAPRDRGAGFAVWSSRGRGTPRPRRVHGALLSALVLVAVLGCGSAARVAHDRPDGDRQTLVVYVGAGDDREILTYVGEHLLPPSVRLTLVEAGADANAKVAAGEGDLAYFQHAPAFEAEAATNATGGLSIVSKVNVVPYGLYSSKWANLAETADWVNNALVGDEVTGTSLPHGARIAVPATPTGFARGLYLLQSAGLVRLDRPFGGTTAVDLTVTEANVLDSLRHLTVVGLGYDEFLDAIYRNYDAVALTPKQAASIGLAPARALATEPGPGNPYAHVLVAPARLAGDPRVLELTHALESPELARFLTERFQGANIAVTAAHSK